MMFGTLPSGVPAVRKLIDYLREVKLPQMQIMCCGGIYKHEGLAEEIGADLYAPDATTRWRSRGESRPPCHRRSADGRPLPPRPPRRRHAPPPANGRAPRPAELESAEDNGENPRSPPEQDAARGTRGIIARSDDMPPSERAEFCYPHGAVHSRAE